MLLLYFLLGAGALYALSTSKAEEPPGPWAQADAERLKGLLDVVTGPAPDKYTVKYRVQVLRWQAVPHPSLPIMVCDYIPGEQLTFDDRTQAIFKAAEWNARYAKPPQTRVKLLKLFYDPAVSADPIGAPDVLYESSGPKNQPGPCG